jgi:NADPH:quinone reductase-like Zn-dependent oxidoreductase
MARSIRIHEFGGPEVLKMEEVAFGEPGAGEVRLRIHAIGINRTEVTLRSGRSPAKPALPASIGFEAAGVIEALDEKVVGFKIGDRVALVPAYGAAQYALYGEVAFAPARSLVAIPDAISFADAAATWAAFGTAWAGLVALAALKSSQTVAIGAASSSVGLAAVQIARRLGANPIALTRTSHKSPSLLEHGAAAVIATGESDAAAELRRLTRGKGADLVFDPVGGATFAKLVQGTANGGTVILYGAMSPEPTAIPPLDILARDVTIRGLALTSVTKNDAQLAALKEFVSVGVADRTLRPTIARTFPLERIVDAHRFVESGEQIGKIVITV